VITAIVVLGALGKPLRWKRCDPRSARSGTRLTTHWPKPPLGCTNRLHPTGSPLRVGPFARLSDIEDATSAPGCTGTTAPGSCTALGAGHPWSRRCGSDRRLAQDGPRGLLVICCSPPVATVRLWEIDGPAHPQPDARSRPRRPYHRRSAPGRTGFVRAWCRPGQRRGPSLSSITGPLTRPPGINSCIRLSTRRKVDSPHPDGPMKAVTGIRQPRLLARHRSSRVRFRSGTRW